MKRLFIGLAVLLCTALPSVAMDVRTVERNSDEVTKEKAEALFKLFSENIPRGGKIMELLTAYPRLVAARDERQRTPLHFAAYNGLMGVYTYLLDHGVEVDRADKAGHTPLHNAAVGGHLDIAKDLLQRGADACAEGGEEDATPLHYAAQKGHLEVCRLLLAEETVNPNDKTLRKETPLTMALKNGHKEVSLLLVKGHRVKVTAADTRKACQGKNMDDVSILLLDAVDGLDVNVLVPDEKAGYGRLAQDGKGTALLHSAASSGQVETCRKLLEMGAAVDPVDEYDRTPFYLAVAGGHLEVVRLLLQHGANSNAPINGGYFPPTPLLQASKRKQGQQEEDYFEIISLLLEHNAEVAVSNSKRETPIHLVAASGSLRTFKLLEKHGAQLDAQDKAGETALHHCTNGRGLEICKYLLEEKGFDARVGSLQGCTPLFYAAFQDNLELIALLMKHGADPKVGNERGETPLHNAAGNRLLEVCQLLLERGADPMRADRNGKIPLYNVAQVGNEDVCKFLVGEIKKTVDVLISEDTSLLSKKDLQERAQNMSTYVSHLQKVQADYGREVESADLPEVIEQLQSYQTELEQLCSKGHQSGEGNSNN